jgi:hypothetical protein
MTDDFDTVAAAALLQQTTAAPRRSLNTRSPLLYGGWGVAWLVGLGAAIWLAWAMFAMGVWLLGRGRR